MKTTYFSSMASGITALIVVATLLMILNYIAKRLTRKIIQEAETQIDDTSKNETFFVPPTMETKEEKDLVQHEESVIINVRDDNSSSNPRLRAKDMNDIQNLTKYNHNTYRASNGRFKSLKEV